MKLLLIMEGDRVITEWSLSSRNEINDTIKRYCTIESGGGDYSWVECRNETVDTAVYIDTDAGTCEMFKLEVKVVSTIVIT